MAAGFAPMALRIMGDSETRDSLAASLSRASVPASSRTLFMQGAYHVWCQKVLHCIAWEADGHDSQTITTSAGERSLYEGVGVLRQVDPGYPAGLIKIHCFMRR